MMLIKPRTISPGSWAFRSLSLEAAVRHAGQMSRSSLLLLKVKNDNDDDRPTPTFVAPPDDADVVKKIMFEGKKYLKSKNTGIIYNMEQDVIGKWNEEKNRIDFDETGEESEEEYDEDV